MEDFQYYIPTKIIFGPGSIERIGQEIQEMGKRAMLVTGRRAMRKFGITERVEKSLKAAGVEIVLYDKAEPNPSTTTVDIGAKIAAEEKCDFVIGLGGGSAIDVAKGIAIVTGCGGGIWDYMEAGKRPEEVKEITSKTLPIMAIPTTSGTGTETTPYAVATNPEKKLKEGTGSLYTFPKISIIDPELAALMPPELTAHTGMDAFGQALEGYTSKFANMATDSLALEAIGLIAHSLRDAYSEGKNLEARSNVAWGAALSGIVISQVDANLAHAMSHVIGAHYDTPHGLAVGLLTPATMEYNLDALPDKYADVAAILGQRVEGLAKEEAAKLAPKAVKNLLDNLGFPSGLREVGVEEKNIEKMAEDTLLMGALTTNIKETKLEDIVNIFQRAM